MSDQSSGNHDAWNELCDADALWGPLVFLRPQPHQAFSRARLLLVTSLFGIFYGMVANVALAVFRRVGLCDPVAVYWLPLILTVTSAVCGDITFLPAWNARARQSRNEL